VCQNHGEFPVNAGIVSFSGNKKFGNHWENYSINPLPDSKVKSAKRFLDTVKSKRYSSDLPFILDAGCGDGVHVVALSEMDSLPSESVTIGLDISMTALQTARLQKGGREWFYVQEDMSKTPFPDELFDVIFSYGALTYTDNPEDTFNELCRILKPGGWLGIWAYPKRKGLGGLLFKLVRTLCRITGKWGTKILANSLVPFLGLLPTQSGVHLGNASWKQCQEVIMVNIAPKRIKFPETREVMQWFEDNSLEILFEDKLNPITIWGEKPK